MIHEPSPLGALDLSTEAFLALGEEVLALMAEALEAERREPVLLPVGGADLNALLDEPLPEDGTSTDEILRVWRERILPYCRRNGHPRFFAYVCTAVDPLGVLADGMASALNQPVTAWRSSPGATTIERLAVRWLDEWVGFGAPEHGLLVSGGSMANFHALACAVTRGARRAGDDDRSRLVAYLSPEGHVSMRKALKVLGIPDRRVRVVAPDSERRLSVPALADAMRDDARSGLMPAVVCASAGTANTGAIDPLIDVADVAERHGAWYHIDGAYGAPAVVTEAYGWMRAAFARADSMSLDPHKWLFAPVDAGCILMRDPDAARDTFTLHSEYTEVVQTDPTERYAFFDQGLEMSRRFRGLKVWTILKARGRSGIRDVIQGNLDLRARLDDRILAEPRLEALGSGLSIACFRYLPANAEGAASPDEALERTNRVNRRIVQTLVADGHVYMSPTELDGRTSLRVCIVNHRTRPEDIDRLVDEVLRIGSEVDGTG